MTQKRKHGRKPTRAQRRRAIWQGYGVARKRERATERLPLWYYRRTQPPRSVREHRTAQWNRQLRRTSKIIVHVGDAARTVIVRLRRLSTILISVPAEEASP